MESNAVCPECGHGKNDSENRHDVPVSEVWSKEVGGDLLGYEYTCPECGHVWEELTVTIQVRQYHTATLVKSSDGSIEVFFHGPMRIPEDHTKEVLGNYSFHYLMTLPTWVWDLREEALHNAIRGYMPGASGVAIYHLMKLMLYSSLYDNEEEGKVVVKVPLKRNAFNVKTLQFEQEDERP